MFVYYDNDDIKPAVLHNSLPWNHKTGSFLKWGLLYIGLGEAECFTQAINLSALPS